jgi:GPI-GlcNAc transferase complex, PIG-H component
MRRIVAMAKPSTSTTAPALSLSPWKAGAAAIVVGFGASRCSSVVDETVLLRADHWTWIPLTMALVLVLVATAAVLYWMACSSTSRRGAAVSIYPLGVQLSTVCTPTKGMDATVDSNEHYYRMTPRMFIPRDRIVDCIVTEVIWAHKVQSLVVFRVSNQSQRSDDTAVQLVSAFPGIEMTYIECLQYRRQINSCLSSV